MPGIGHPPHPPARAAFWPSRADPFVPRIPLACAYRNTTGQALAPLGRSTPSQSSPSRSYRNEEPDRYGGHDEPHEPAGWIIAALRHASEVIGASTLHPSRKVPDPDGRAPAPAALG